MAWPNSTLALKVLKRILHMDATLQPFVEALRANDQGGQSVKLAGFDLFSQTKHAAVYEWTVPRFSGASDDLVFAYEQYVDSGFGVKATPKRPFAGKVPATYLNGSRLARAWYEPLVKLLAQAQHFPGATVSRTQDGYSAQLGQYHLAVSPAGCWSNFHKTFVTAPCTGLQPNISTPQLESRHPIAKAVASLLPDTDVSAQWALNTILRTLREGGLEELQIYQAFGIPKIPEKSDPDREIIPDAVKQQRIEEAQVLLRTEPKGLLPRLHQILVPDVCKAVDFVRLFGSPYGDYAQSRSTAKKTRDRWREKVDDLIWS